MVLGTLIALSTPRSGSAPRRGSSRRKRPKPRSRDRTPPLAGGPVDTARCGVGSVVAAVHGASDPPPEAEIERQDLEAEGPPQEIHELELDYETGLSDDDYRAIEGRLKGGRSRSCSGSTPWRQNTADRVFPATATGGRKCG